MSLSNEPKGIDKEREKAKEAMEGWKQKMQGVVDAKTGHVSLTADGMILGVSFKGGPYIRVVYGEEGHPSQAPFSFYRSRSKDEFFASSGDGNARNFVSAEDLDIYFSRPLEEIKQGS